MESNPLKRKSRPLPSKQFAVPLPKKPRTKSPKPSSPSTTSNTKTAIATANNHHHNRANNTPTTSIKSSRSFQPQIHENKHNVKYAYLYDYHGIIPPAHSSTLNTHSNSNNNLHSPPRIEFRIPLNLLSMTNNPLIQARQVWGGGDINQQQYTMDSDIVCVLYHSGLINLYGMKPDSASNAEDVDSTDSELDVFALLNKCLSININGSDEDMSSDYNFMYTRTSTHKMSKDEIEEEHNMDHTQHNKLNKLLNDRDMIGIAVVCEVLPALNVYHSVNHHGYYSRAWKHSTANGTDLQSMRLLHVYPLTDFNDFLIDHKYLFAMLAVTKPKIPEISADEDNKKNNDEHVQQEEWAQAENGNHEKSNALLGQCDQIGFVFNRENRPCLRYNLSVIGNANLLLNQVEYMQEQKERIERHGKYENYVKRNRSRNEQLSDDSDDEDYKASVRGKKGGKRGSNHNESEQKMADIRLNYNDQEKRYGHLLQFRLQKYTLMMENHERQYQLAVNTKVMQTAMNSIAMNANNARKYKLNKMEFAQGVNAGMKAKKHSSKIADDLSWHELKWSEQGLTVRGNLYRLHTVWFTKNAVKK